MISVCLPTYNGSRFIVEQIDSILNQLTDDDEIIIFDDNSTDGTINIIRNINDSRIKIYENKKFTSYVYNYENALNLARGDIIFLSDQDDVWLSNKIEIMCNALHDCDLVLSDCYVTDSNLNITQESYFEQRHTVKNRIWSLIGPSPYLGCCLAFKRVLLKKAIPFPLGISSHDIWLGNIAAFYFRVKYINDKLIYYRRHSGNTSIMAGTSKISNLSRLFDRLKTIYYLTSRLWTACGPVAGRH